MAKRTLADAQRRVANQTAIDLSDFALLMNVSQSTASRTAARGDLPVPAMQMGQRWIIPSAPVREFLRLTGAEQGAA